MGRRPARVHVPLPSQGHEQAASSTQVLSTDKHKPARSSTTDFLSPTSDWDVNPRPPEGFVSYLQNPSSFPVPGHPPNQQAMSQNFHFIGGPSQYPLPFMAPTQSVPTGFPSPTLYKSSTPLASSGLQSKCINLTGGEEVGDSRTEKRLIWTKDEDLKLMGAWLRNSNDPIGGNNKKSDQYWGDVTRDYNSNIPENRRRQVKQAKDHWHTLNKLVYQFQCSWTKACAIYASGQSNLQLRDKALAFYEDDYKTQFHHIDVWLAIGEQPKWITYNEWIQSSKKRKIHEAKVAEENALFSKEVGDIPNPIGSKSAKAKRNGKGKSKEVAADMELLDKLVASQDESKRSRNEMIEMKQRLSADKLETTRLSVQAARLSAEAAKDNNEARKQDKEVEMMRAYRALLVQDTIGMTEEMRNEHMKTLKIMRDRLFNV